MFFTIVGIEPEGKRKQKAEMVGLVELIPASGRNRGTPHSPLLESPKKVYILRFLLFLLFL